MAKTKVGIIREEKVPIDRRVPFIPEQTYEITQKFPEVEIVVQNSPIRCYEDNEYQAQGIEVCEDLSDCDILFGVKEVPPDLLIPGKTYFFFSHTIKEQSYNRILLQTVLRKGIKLVDYEVLTDTKQNRIVAFGRYAGIVGAYNGIWTFGKRYDLFDLRRAHECFDLEDLKTEFQKVALPPVKVVITGGGRVAKGAMEVLAGMGIRKITPGEFLNQKFQEPVFTQLEMEDYHLRMDGGNFDLNEFFRSPEKYNGDFLKYAHMADLLIACAFWSPSAPVLFERADMLAKDFKIRVIADVTCDIEGSIPSTKKPSTIADPIYDYDPDEDKVLHPLDGKDNITVMAIDNLPAELPRDASRDFGRDLIDKALPHLFGTDPEGIIRRATIAEQGDLTENFEYLRSYTENN